MLQSRPAGHGCGLNRMNAATHSSAVVAYVRADLADRLAEAVRDMLTENQSGSITAAERNAIAALAAYEGGEDADAQ